VFPVLCPVLQRVLSQPVLPARRNYRAALTLAHARPVRTLKAHTGAVSALLPFGDMHVVSGSYDKSIKVWNTADWSCETTLCHHTGAVYCFVAAGTRLLSGSADGTIGVWDMERRVLERILTGHTLAVLCLCVVGTDRAGHVTAVASAGNDKTIRIWNARTWVCDRVLLGHTDAIKCLCAVGPGRVLSGGYDKILHEWDWPTGHLVSTSRGSGTIHSLLWLPASQRLLSGGKDGSMSTWSRSTATVSAMATSDGVPWQLTKTYAGHSDAVWVTVAGDPDGAVVVSGALDKRLRVWDTLTLRSERELVGHTHGVLSLALCHDGRRAMPSAVASPPRGTSARGISMRHEQDADPHGLHARGPVLVSGSLDASIIVWGVSQ
jgi:WD40 repeat protein